MARNRTLVRRDHARQAAPRIAVLAACAALASACLNARPPLTVKVERTPQRIARGAYLAQYLTDCIGCHSERLIDRYGLPLKPGGEGAGGPTMTREMGLPGQFTPNNLTSDPETGLGAWSDGELLRAIREGVGRDGRALFPLMPYPAFRALSDEDAFAIVAYLRTLPPVAKRTPPPQLDFPVNLFVRMLPRPVTESLPPVERAKDPLAYGDYLVTIGGCRDCHSPRDAKGGPVMEQQFAGGNEFKLVGLDNVAPNLTPHPDGYLGRATKDEFIGRFRAFANINASNAPRVKRNNTFMPWLAFAHLTDEDLGAIYDYLRTVKPIAKQHDPFPGGPIEFVSSDGERSAL